MPKKTPTKAPEKPVGKKFGYSGLRLTVKQWEAIRAAYESGEHKSFEDLHREFTKKGLLVPSVTRLKQVCAKEHWQKAALLPEIREAMHEKYLRIAREEGLDDRAIVKSVMKLLNEEAKDSSAVNMGIQRFMDLTGTKAPLKVARTDSEGVDTAPDTIFVVPANGFEPRKKS